MQTLHRMYIVNAGAAFKKMLWPAAQKFLDPKTISKIQVKEHFFYAMRLLSSNTLTILY